MCDHFLRLPLGMGAVQPAEPPFGAAGRATDSLATDSAFDPVYADDELPPLPPGMAPGMAPGSRRRRLWELPRETHCALVGVCFGLDALRKLVGKAVGGAVQGDDYEVHVGAVRECLQRNRLSEAMQRDLDRRHELTIRQWAALKTADAVEARWRAALTGGVDVAAALWVALTHPRCDLLLQERITRDIHMLQHQIGASERIDRASHRRALEAAKALDAELTALRDRSGTLLRERAAELERVQGELMQLRAEGVARVTTIANLSAELERVRADVPDLDSRRRLGERARLLWERCREQDARLAELRRELESARCELLRSELARVETERTDRSAARPAGADEAAAAQSGADAAERAPFALNDRAVLCVGGRVSNVAGYREAVEGTGARFLHHDGGLEDKVAQLDGCLAAADLVICQTGCISHSAYWRVKDHCKRTGKRCVFVENPSRASLERSLTGIAAD